MKIIPKLGGLFYFPSILLGFEQLCIACLEDPVFAGYVFERVGVTVAGLVSRFVHHPAVGAIWLSSDIAFGSSLFVSPDVLRSFVFPWVRNLAEICHQSEMPMIFHSDGDLTAIIPDLIEAGIDALHPIEPAAMDIYEVQREYGERLCLVGNVDVGEVLVRGSPQDVRRSVRELAGYFTAKGGYVLGSSNSIPPSVPVENFKALIDIRSRMQ